jgi:hypothetical protein
MGLLDYQYHQSNFVDVSKHCAWHAHLLISSVPTLLCSTKSLCLIVPHLMSLFSTLAMFSTTFLSRFPLQILIISNQIYMKYNLPHYIRNELCIFKLVFAIDSKVMVIGSTHDVQVCELHDGIVSFFTLWFF